ncbi:MULTISPECIES: FAD-containing oxidoreductase [Agrobacterium]|jgi:pyruvate/2-oxoglutarate dehydrogenase complex dihydrolipoamide dehydrogenase (E3) component|uniref:FAD-containing oxidoreductase n=1 Tax=Agrobacterium TaxID=357 RepID=UPI000DC01B9B|nr:FAD-containing oxidoreductase [Agrobacterium sp. MS2]RAL95361.1 FAD-containing oxidoreductase [Agrobacterium sp. MS2]
MREYDAIFIGAGQAGPFLAARMAAMGRKVVLIERKYLGGTCVNAGCMPTKALVASAKTAEVARRASEFGVTISGEPIVNMPAVAARARKVTLDARNGLASWFDSLETMDVIHGQAKFVGARAVSVDGTDYTAPQIFINVGARPHIPDIPGLEDVPYLSSTSVIALEKLPKHLIVLGGSYIGLEFAQMYRRFGAEVTVIERGQQLAPREDTDISQAIAEILSRDGIKVLLNRKLLSFTKEDVGVVVRTDQGEVSGSHVLVALGRRPNTDDLGLDLAGIETDQRGFITVDERLQTTAEGIWALGDCNGRGAFTHTSYNDFEIVAANLLDGGNRKVSDRTLGYGLYIDPPLGRVGMTERQAKEAGHRIKVSTRPMSRVGRAVEKGETLGLMKLVADAETDRILGAAFLGVGGDEAVYGVLDAINLGATTEELRWAVPIHPTVGELVPTLIGDLRET